MTDKEFISQFKEFCLSVAEREMAKPRQTKQISFTEAKTTKANNTTKPKYKTFGGVIEGVYKGESKNNNKMTTIGFLLDNGEKVKAYLTWTKYRIKDNINNFLRPLGIDTVGEDTPISKLARMDLGFLKDWEVEVEVKFENDFISVDRITRVIKSVEDDEIPF